MKTIKLKIVRSGKFYWKPQHVPHRCSMGVFTYVSQHEGQDLYEVQHQWVTHFYQIFIWFWIIAIDITPDKKGFAAPQKYVRFKEVNTDKSICAYPNNCLCINLEGPSSICSFRK